MKHLWRQIKAWFQPSVSKFPETEKLSFIEGEAIDDDEPAPQVPVGTDVVHVNGNGSREYAEDEYSDYRGTPLMKALAPSGIWIVVKFSTAVEEGGYDEDGFKAADIVKGREGLDAIEQVYARDLKSQGERSNITNLKMEDGRYVALDFYTGHRVEALVEGGWTANVKVAD